MSYRNLLAIAAVIALAFGVGFVLVPAQVAAYYGLTLNPAGAFVAQLFGAALIGFAVLNWAARGAEASQPISAVILANLVGDGVGFVIALMGQMAGTGGLNQMGWVTVAIYLLLALGFAYLQFAKPGAS